MKVALAGIIRDEFSYLLEWIAFHRGIGIDHFIIANHGSEDGSTELLEALQKLGIVTTYYINRETEAPQLPAYKKIVEDYGFNYDWLGFMDADEFLVPEEDISFRELLADQNEATGAVVFNLAFYGSSFQKYPDNFELPSPVTSRFSWRGVDEMSLLVKTFHRTKAIELNPIYLNVNTVNIKKEFNYVSPSGALLDFHKSPLPHHTKEVRFKTARINHYTIKSKWEFVNRKKPKGLADKSKGTFRDWRFFYSHDNNDVFDPLPSKLVVKRDEQIRLLKNQLKSVGYLYPERKEIQKQVYDYKFGETYKIDNNLCINVLSSRIDLDTRFLDFDISIEDAKNQRFYPNEIVFDRNNAVHTESEYFHMQIRFLNVKSNFEKPFKLMIDGVESGKEFVFVDKTDIEGNFPFLRRIWNNLIKTS